MAFIPKAFGMIAKAIKTKIYERASRKKSAYAIVFCVCNRLLIFLILHAIAAGHVGDDSSRKTSNCVRSLSGAKGCINKNKSRPRG
ncbi:MAG: hypothetical protein US74_C0020G0002 [Parcubacteria group bacterium GW2011_GWA2_38_13]|nr:MAG: hypothetical protein US74_C0020G0002 [Parcubacteria group bacterium GW2011_GWA2_38_13]